MPDNPLTHRAGLNLALQCSEPLLVVGQTMTDLVEIGRTAAKTVAHNLRGYEKDTLRGMCYGERRAATPCVFAYLEESGLSDSRKSATPWGRFVISVIDEDVDWSPPSPVRSSGVEEAPAQRGPHLIETDPAEDDAARESR